MNLNALLEHAQLDALGLLDEQEAAAFEAAFRAASSSVKAQIRDEQARWAQEQILLSTDLPSAALRDRVLMAIDQQAALSAHAQLVAESPEFDLRSPRRVAPAWRTGGVALLCACLVLGVAFIKVYSDNAEMQRALSNDRQLTSLTTLWGNGQQMSDMLFSPGTTRALFAMEPSAPATAKGEACLYMHTGWPSARLFVSGITANPGENLRLVVVSETNVVERELVTLLPNANMQSMQVNGLSKGMRVAIVSAKNNAPASSGVVLMVTNV